MHDNAPPRKALTVRKWLQKKGGVKPLDWPPQSPDYRTIENLWQILSRRVYMHKFATKDDLVKKSEGGMGQDWKRHPGKPI